MFLVYTFDNFDFINDLVLVVMLYLLQIKHRVFKELFVAPLATDPLMLPNIDPPQIIAVLKKNTFFFSQE